MAGMTTTGTLPARATAAGGGDVLERPPRRGPRRACEAWGAVTCWSGPLAGARAERARRGGRGGPSSGGGDAAAAALGELVVGLAHGRAVDPLGRELGELPGQLAQRTGD